ncbi:MAG: hypothetical protein LAN64_15740 [Acidobacteriia bacterium]|nr:hypothetical protein [Terriglobia bacterium]
MIPADIPDRLLVTKTRRKLDPVKQLTQAGYPFNHIGTELVEIQGKFEIVSKDVALLKSEFKTLQDNIEKKIDKETSTISEAISGIPEKIDNKMRSTFAEQFGLHFDQRMLRVYGGGITLATLAAGMYKLIVASAPSSVQGYLLIGLAAIFALVTLLLARNPRLPSGK